MSHANSFLLAKYCTGVCVVHFYLFLSLIYSTQWPRSQPPSHVALLACLFPGFGCSPIFSSRRRQTGCSVLFLLSYLGHKRPTTGKVSEYAAVTRNCLLLLFFSLSSELLLASSRYQLNSFLYKSLFRFFDIGDYWKKKNTYKT